MLTNEIDGVPVRFCFNLDETRQNQFVNTRSLYLIIPKDQEVTTYPVSGAAKRITLLNCISTDESRCNPMIIILRLMIIFLMKLH